MPHTKGGSADRLLHMIYSRVLFGRASRRYPCMNIDTFLHTVAILCVLIHNVRRDWHARAGVDFIIVRHKNTPRGILSIMALGLIPT